MLSSAVLSFGARRWSFETWPGDAQLTWALSRHGLALMRHGRDVQPSGYPLGIFRAEAIATALADILAARMDRFPGWWDALPGLRYQYAERYTFLRPTRYAPRQECQHRPGLAPAQRRRGRHLRDRRASARLSVLQGTRLAGRR